jgi:hypothetical protein
MMKKHLFTLILTALITCTIAAQEKTNYIGISSHFNTSDTTYSFNINSKNIDITLQKLTTIWGNPEVNTPGEISWSGKEIPNLSNELTLQILDKLCTKIKKYLECKPFSNAKEKSKKLQNIKPNQFRSITITITDKSKNNIINSSQKAKQMKEYLEEIIAG